MPFSSQVQRKWMFSNKPEMAHRWADETPNMKGLPEKVKRVHEAAKKIKKAHK